MLRISRSIRQTQILIKLQTFRPLSTSSRMSDKSSLDANKGSVGKEFTPKGKVGGIMQDKIGGPFDKDGVVGKQFKTDGPIGGTAQSAAEQMQGDKKPVFDKDGAVGKQFKADGAIGSIGEKVGGPFASDGAIGKNFNPDGAVGGTVQENMGSGKK
ncbi:uncharacterized protein PV06_07519 [Exophiala oligosperma]|uniref:Uncharacterized protein n=1 Tax=Exophiala oligosperma TaxID=215243 RepID=A0A0D2BS81_9EURO|nr:uncharacterized protein PV06_07519 [Exophiala oligosperma]KIW40312.1 hypothetical protein PV06_07519 [Exophiala oligosperma]